MRKYSTQIISHLLNRELNFNATCTGEEGVFQTLLPVGHRDRLRELKQQRHLELEHERQRELEQDEEKAGESAHAVGSGGGRERAGRGGGDAREFGGGGRAPDIYFKKRQRGGLQFQAYADVC